VEKVQDLKLSSNARISATRQKTDLCETGTPAGNVPFLTPRRHFQIETGIGVNTCAAVSNCSDGNPSSDPATNTLQAERHLQSNFGKQVCSPTEFAAMQPVLKRIERDTRSQIVVKSISTVN
jgi:hypothetical protein